MSRKNLRLALYRTLQTKGIERFILPRLKAMRPTLVERSQTYPHFTKSIRSRIWFHAASAGELESLWTLVELSSARGDEIILSVFSPSARIQLDRLAKSLTHPPLFVSYSPWDGRWREALTQLKPTSFVSAKYEAWPELWASLAETEIPLTIVGAKKRKSLTVAARVCKLLGSPLPKIRFALTSGQDQAGLEDEFPAARFQVCGDPRWDRVYARLKQGNARAELLIRSLENAPRPWGVLAQIWSEDLAIWESLIQGATPTVWIVPHKVDAESLAPVEEFLQKHKLTYVKTSSLSSVLDSSHARFILVDEIGFLTELYSQANWVYIGGGFGIGVHSTIEPAVHGIPLSCGAVRADHFPEIGILRASKQLTVVRNTVGLEAWLRLVPSFSNQHKIWKTEAEARQGATERVYDFLIV